MRDLKIVIRQIETSLITVARTAPIQKTIIVKLNNQVIETISELKQKETDLLGTTPTVPRIAPDVQNY